MRWFFVVSFAVLIATVAIMGFVIKNLLRKLTNLNNGLKTANEKLNGLVNKLQMKGVIDEKLHTSNGDDDFVNSVNMLHNSKTKRNADTAANSTKRSK